MHFKTYLSHILVNVFIRRFHTAKAVRIEIETGAWGDSEEKSYYKTKRRKRALNYGSCRGAGLPEMKEVQPPLVLLSRCFCYTCSRMWFMHRVSIFSWCDVVSQDDCNCRAVRGCHLNVKLEITSTFLASISWVRRVSTQMSYIIMSVSKKKNCWNVTEYCLLFKSITSFLPHVNTAGCTKCHLQTVCLACRNLDACSRFIHFISHCVEEVARGLPIE